MDTIISRVEKLIEETGLSIRELAEAANCSKSAMQRYIAGERDMPTSVVEGLAIAFRVHPAYLFGWVDDRNYSPNKKRPATEEGDGLTVSQRGLIELVKLCPEDKADDMLQAMQLFLQNWNK